MVGNNKIQNNSNDNDNVNFTSDDEEKNSFEVESVAGGKKIRGNEPRIEGKSLGRDISDNQENELDVLKDVPVYVSAELGRLDLTIKELLSLNKGTILELDKLAGEPLEIYVNNRLICKGEVIVIGDKYGVRMTDIVDPHENPEIKTKTSQG